MAENVMPTKRNGKESSQIIGQSTKASKASGQHSTKRMHQAIVTISVFINRILVAPYAPVNHGGMTSLHSRFKCWQPVCDESAGTPDQTTNMAIKSRA